MGSSVSTNRKSSCQNTENIDSLCFKLFINITHQWCYYNAIIYTTKLTTYISITKSHRIAVEFQYHKHRLKFTHFPWPPAGKTSFRQSSPILTAPKTSPASFFKGRFHYYFFSFFWVLSTLCNNNFIFVT